MRYSTRVTTDPWSDRHLHGYVRLAMLLHQILVSIMNGMAASAKQLEKHLLFWDKYKHLWEVCACACACVCEGVHVHVHVLV